MALRNPDMRPYPIFPGLRGFSLPLGEGGPKGRMREKRREAAVLIQLFI